MLDIALNLIQSHPAQLRLRTSCPDGRTTAVQIHNVLTGAVAYPECRYLAS